MKKRHRSDEIAAETLVRGGSLLAPVNAGPQRDSCQKRGHYVRTVRERSHDTPAFAGTGLVQHRLGRCGARRTAPGGAADRCRAARTRDADPARIWRARNCERHWHSVATRRSEMALV